METIEIFGYLGALLVGLVLGLMGSGGSLIAIPIFTYLFHISPITTTAYSLFVVGTSSTIGALRNWEKGLVDFKIAFVFAIPAFIAVYVVRKYILPIIPMEIVTIYDIAVTKDMAIMVFLALIMLLCSLSMIRTKKSLLEHKQLNRYNYPLIVLQGILIGLFTGFVGIGGGFLIIPTLVLLVKLPMKKAVATSLFIIALKSLIGFLGDLGNLEINWSFLLRFTAISTLGIFLGIYFSSFIKGEKLKTYFGWLLLILSIGIFYMEVFT
ncbi:sulfite exporter TauE/SafE family protein [Maribacter sp. TH_r10]|uniref:sulfite exporter TauE/SafE family protein n=1 Tax=Maribacter sp. TH_r10 TaxID=3082086 RepID=UPI0029559EAC|nr:sulfite exporter TauE/SafE family protein [Maribacter sp. TH_r10]MDV7139382.1 sulfite exporter TauE/SafE family protein [Maribacter sp. TH_r10]